jgi:starch phosphorylase
VEADGQSERQVGDQVRAQAWIHLGDLAPEDVRVEFYIGRVDAEGEIVNAEAVSMEPAGPVEGEQDVYLFEVEGVTFRLSGLHGYTVRVLPHHVDLVTPFLPGLITWAEGEERGE